MSVNTINQYRANFNVSTYIFFDLRDYKTDGIWSDEFGLMHDDYSPKPAFCVYQQLIRSSPW